MSRSAENRPWGGRGRDWNMSPLDRTPKPDTTGPQVLSVLIINPGDQSISLSENLRRPFGADFSPSKLFHNLNDFHLIKPAYSPSHSDLLPQTGYKKVGLRDVVQYVAGLPKQTQTAFTESLTRLANFAKWESDEDGEFLRQMAQKVRESLPEVKAKVTQKATDVVTFLLDERGGAIDVGQMAQDLAGVAKDAVEVFSYAKTYPKQTVARVGVPVAGAIALAFCTPAPKDLPPPTPRIEPVPKSTATLVQKGEDDGNGNGLNGVRPTVTSSPTVTREATRAPTATATVEVTKTPVATATPITVESLHLPPPETTWTGILALNQTGEIPATLTSREWDNLSWSEWTDRSDGGDKKSRVSIEIVQDTAIGPAYKYTINSLVGSNNENFRTYAAKYGPKYPYSVDWSMESSVLFGPGSTAAYLSLQNEFDKIGEKSDGLVYHLMSAVDIRNRVMVLLVRPPDAFDNSRDIVVEARNSDGTIMQVNENTAYKITKFTYKGKYYLAVNGNIVAQADIPPGYEGASPRGIKSGAYGNRIKPGSYFFETPIKMDFRKR